MTLPAPLDPKVAKLVERYNTGFRRTAEGYIEMGTAVYEAGDLGRTDRDAFYHAIGLKEDDPSSSKLRLIGKERLRLIAIKEKLPNHWTTLYQLVKFEKTRFDQLNAEGRIHPKVTSNDLQGKKPTSTKVRRSVSINLNQIDKGKQADFAKRLKQLLSEFKVEIKKPQMNTLLEFLPPEQPAEKTS